VPRQGLHPTYLATPHDAPVELMGPILTDIEAGYGTMSWSE
jgi:hypothetical protein